MDDELDEKLRELEADLSRKMEAVLYPYPGARDEAAARLDYLCSVNSVADQTGPIARTPSPYWKVRTGH